MNNVGTRKAFTLVEVLVAIAIIGILVSIALPIVSCTKGNVASATEGNAFKTTSINWQTKLYYGTITDKGHLFLTTCITQGTGVGVSTIHHPACSCGLKAERNER